MSRRIVESWHRFYDPATGRYISADPIGLAGGMNLYAYVENNPVNAIDTLGLHPHPPGSEDSSDWRENPNLHSHHPTLIERINDPDAWWNDPNHPLARSYNLGEILGDTACVLTCMGTKYPVISAAAMAEGAVILGLSTATGTQGTILVLTLEAGSNTGTINEFRKALQGCTNECKCNEK